MEREISSTVSASELHFLEKNLVILNKKLEYSFVFEPIEPWIILKFIGNKFGHIEIQGEAYDQLGIGNTLSFSLVIDQTYLGDIINALKNIIDDYPVKGK